MCILYIYIDVYAYSCSPYVSLISGISSTLEWPSVLLGCTSQLESCLYFAFEMFIAHAIQDIPYMRYDTVIAHFQTGIHLQVVYWQWCSPDPELQALAVGERRFRTQPYQDDWNMLKHGLSGFLQPVLWPTVGSPAFAGLIDPNIYHESHHDSSVLHKRLEEETHVQTGPKHSIFHISHETSHYIPSYSTHISPICHDYLIIPLVFRQLHTIVPLLSHIIALMSYMMDFSHYPLWWTNIVNLKITILKS